MDRRGLLDRTAHSPEERLLLSRTRKNEFMEALTNFVGGAVL